ncbi:YqgE/AlgH family protein [Methylotenera versatilis]|uniref:YqgE/AlgH family protein n=1 Tax=Methylotenera versatilis TaxID=1055487 RepID=UPI000648F6F1|nr:YqgE/AlgH family protein [Methylotenera versatilis]
MENINLTGQFLIAMPAMLDPRFSKTITYICTHNQDGAMGVIVNRATDITLTDLFEQIKLDSSSTALLEKTVHYGGPVQTDRGFILHTPQIEYNSTILVGNTIALTTSKDILEAAAENNGPEKMLVALGYAGWTPGQLEEEMLNNSWLSLDTNNLHDIHALIFDAPNLERFDLAMQLMGLNWANLSDVAGHA